MDPALSTLLNHVVIGTLSGGVTNTIAVWMLFNPKQRRFGIQGAIPKNQARLARSIGRMVGERLLTPADLQQELNRPELRAAFDLKLTELVRSVITSEQPLIDKVPPAVVTALGAAMTDYLPIAMEKLGGFLGQPATRDKLRVALHSLFDKFVNDLRFHERVLAKLMVTENKMDRALDAIETEGVEHVVNLLDDPVIREEISKTIHDAVLEYLQKPIGEILGNVTDAHDPQAPDRIAGAMAPIIWTWIHDQLPSLVQRLDIQQMVEKKVMAFSIERVEELLRSVIQNELTLIVVLGYVFGAVVGVMTFGLSVALGL
ncbi:MAG TPA: DUF445 family protein [Gemmatimonadaceae bacterium]|nr:DUF445 family protein [Gemmatimonadaceae bacterium]